MPLFTFYFDYKGGTYISQVRARSYRSAPKIWARKLDASSIPKLEEDFNNKLIKSVSEVPPVALNGIINTWCCGLLFIRRGIVHFTQTTE